MFVRKPDCNFRAAPEILRVGVMTENRLGAGGWVEASRIRNQPKETST